LPLTGPLSYLGRSATNALNLAVEEINSIGGIRSLGGEPISFDIRDWESSPSIVAMQTDRFADERVPLLIGAGTASSTLIAAKISQKYRLPIINCTSNLSNDNLEELSNLYSMAGTITKSVDAVMNFIVSRTKGRVLVVYEDTDVGIAMRDSIINFEKKHNIDIMETISVHYGDDDIFYKIASIIDHEKVILFQAFGQTLGFKMMNTFQEKGIKPYMWVNMSAGLNIYDYLKYEKYISEGMITISPYLPSLRIKGNREFVEKYFKHFGIEPDILAGMYWNCAWFVKDIFERSRSKDPTAIINALSTISLSENEALERNIFISGGIEFNRSGSNVRHHPLIIEIQDGQPKIVWPERFKTNN
jgi:branched-chain amino acid transport system substrate-binding protein